MTRRQNCGRRKLTRVQGRKEKVSKVRESERWPSAPTKAARDAAFIRSHTFERVTARLLGTSTRGSGHQSGFHAPLRPSAKRRNRASRREDGGRDRILTVRASAIPKPEQALDGPFSSRYPPWVGVPPRCAAPAQGVLSGMPDHGDRFHREVVCCPARGAGASMDVSLNPVGSMDGGVQ